MEFNKEHAVIVLKRVFEAGVISDQITLISGEDDQRFSVHRAILTAVSKYFAALLGPNFQEGSKTEFTLDDADGETVKAIVNFCYTGRIDLTEENVAKFLSIASGIQFELLEAKCCQFYNDKLSVENSIGVLMIADKFSVLDLRRRAFNLICESFETVLSTNIQRLDQRLLHELLKCDEIQATEESVLKRLLEWFQSEEDERGPHMPELLKLIRLKYIPSQFLNDNTLHSAYKRFDCFELLIAEYASRVPCSDIGVRRFRPLFCLFAQHKGYGGAEYSAVKIEKCNSLLNSFEEAEEIALGDRTHFGVIFQRTKLYVLGGEVNNVVLKSVSVYDLNSGEEEILPEMNFARKRFASILFGKYIYVFGGQNGSETMNTCERFDIETKTWETIKSMNVARYYASVTGANGYIYVVGGRKTSKTFYNTVEVYDPKIDEWVQLAPMNKLRSAFVLIKTNGFLYAIGTDKAIETFDPWKNCWTEIGSFNGSAHITSTIEIEGEIVVIKNQGDLGRINFNEHNGCSFVPLSESKYTSTYGRRRYLCRD